MKLDLYLELELELEHWSLEQPDEFEFGQLNPCFSYTQVLGEACHILKQE